MNWHNLLMVIFFITVYSLFYTPTVNIRNAFDESQKTFIDTRVGLNSSNLQNIGAANLPRLPTNLTGVPNNKCLLQGLYLGPEERFQNCELLCGNKNVVYKYLAEKDVIIFNSEKLDSGSWCLPAEYNSCNLSVSKILWDANQNSWSCIAKTELFGGPGNNQIIGCRGYLYNTRTKKTYKDYIPSNLNIKDIDEKWINADGVEQYVYECAKVYDERGNELIKNDLGNRFQLQKNYCATYLYNSSLADTDFVNNKCVCKAPLTNLYNIDELPCSSCKHGPGKFNDVSLESKDAYALAIPCVDNKTNFEDIDTSHPFVLCGKNKFDGQGTACFTANILITKAGLYQTKFEVTPLSRESPLAKDLIEQGKIETNG